MVKTTLALIVDIVMIVSGFILVVIFFVRGFDIYLMLCPLSVIFSSVISLYVDLKKKKSDTQK
ncbi:hypothetical protein [Staphylococcus delphini]|uniref:Uncharacterized protein n=1 Tax=Staphylococcus delphini TaxID=53344 RepID=A0A2A4H076_9STAP|nr:hypothetical protein [Staphylococcus delphini]PCF40078.1 hypothetical protein B5C06_10240 [Staphylococcus delphini]PCF56788.1 hypothetical protein B5C08_01770 [Staphylococcus delphini]PCF62955.1 hypothetical protein B5C01_02270 [Staphylococcus delphini]PCF72658.1 hypothetical protein B4W72_07770 [Staphylococcus delphini]HEC2157879.1 hypothetical protein [Staphylococcus delphini]